jgi:RNA polymerase sigma-70 factor (ECF subfamily)
MFHRSNDSNGLDVQHLVSQAVDGDAGAFGKLYQAYMEPIYRYILLRVGRRVVAERLTEDTFVESWERLPQYRRGSADAFAVWLYRIARSTVVDYLYERRELPPAARVNGQHEPADLLPSDLSTFNLPALGSPPPSNLLEALRELSDVEQDVAILAYVEELPVRTIALIIDRSTDSCRQMQKRVLLKLVQLFKYQPLDDDER